ncbi:MAG: endonuclease/exonuclease/phosphatase family protein [Bacteroidetes bacterium]|nr:MAG: endonuclease/exonuclease/phosphatase family protein [Bacteroidota bacterium]
MRRFIVGIYAILLVGSVLFSGCQKGMQKLKKAENGFTVGFYNLENLFDTTNDPLINDEEFLPEAKVSWNSERYEQKLKNMSRVIAAMDTLSFPHILGLSEVENMQVLYDLVQTAALKKAAYAIIHVADNDPRGIEVAMLYRPEFFIPLFQKTLQPVVEGKTNRHILYVKGIMATGDTLHVFANHWTSRFGGYEETKAARNGTALFLRNSIDSLFKINPSAQIIIGGDFNDNPEDASMTEFLNTKSTQDEIRPSMLYNLALEPHKKGEGTLYYKGWDFFDQIIVSSALLSGSRLKASPIEIVKKEWMLFKPSQGEARPNRTMSGGKYYGGFSDHLPVIIRLK